MRLKSGLEAFESPQPKTVDVKKTVGCDASGFAFSKPHWVLVFGRDFLRIFIDAEVVVVIPGMYHYSSHDPMTEA